MDKEEERALTVSTGATVALPVSVKQAVTEWKEYQRLTQSLLDTSDYQQIGSKSFKKKSAWRKYARAFNISDRVTYEEVKRDVDDFPLFARVRVEARAPNGRVTEADHECHVRERCCAAAMGQRCERVSWKNHRCCALNCTGKQHWSHPGDLVATATTRAKNRAISDMIGAGEVTAEEMEGQRLESEANGHGAAPVRHQATSEGPPTSSGDGSRDIRPITEPQRKRLFHIAKKGGHSHRDIAQWLQRIYGVTHTDEILRHHYEAICTRLAETEPLNSTQAASTDDDFLPDFDAGAEG